MDFQVPSAHTAPSDDSSAAATPDRTQPDTSFMAEPQSGTLSGGASAADAAMEPAALPSATWHVQGSHHDTAYQDQPWEESASEPIADSTLLQVDGGAAVSTVPDLGAQTAAPSSPPAADGLSMPPPMQNSSEPNVLQASEQPPAALISSASHGAEAAAASRHIPPAELEDQSPDGSMAADGPAVSPALTGKATRQCTGLMLDSNAA